MGNNIIIDWFLWQFFETPKFLLLVWGNYLSFTENFFSVGFLFKTLFSPWRKMNWPYPKRFDIYQFFLSLTSNIFSRFLGALMRIILIIIGIICYLFVVVLGAVIVIAWFILPFLAIVLFLYAIL